jgi:hypothetical protein
LRRIDHVILGVRDLDSAAARLRDETGLDAVTGSRFPDQGTGNVIVPLGSQYWSCCRCEEAAENQIARWFMARLDEEEPLRAITHRRSGERQRSGQGAKRSARSSFSRAAIVAGALLMLHQVATG